MSASSMERFPITRSASLPWSQLARQPCCSNWGAREKSILAPKGVDPDTLGLPYVVELPYAFTSGLSCRGSC